MINDWKRQRIVYLCGSGLYDDWYWMLATVSGDRPPLAVRRLHAALTALATDNGDRPPVTLSRL
jgi:hypothetical protein